MKTTNLALGDTVKTLDKVGRAIGAVNPDKTVNRSMAARAIIESHEDTIKMREQCLSLSAQLVKLILSFGGEQAAPQTPRSRSIKHNSNVEVCDNGR